MEEKRISAIKDARLAAGLTQAKMSELLEIPKRTIESWEEGSRSCPLYVQKLIINELKRFAENNKRI